MSPLKVYFSNIFIYLLSFFMSLISSTATIYFFQLCIPGYTRSNVETHGHLGTCVPCQCNGHATLCDSNTGECHDCQHNTDGGCLHCVIVNTTWPVGWVLSPNPANK